MISNKQPLQTLLSGFGPFGNVTDNPTERLMHLFATLVVPGHELTVCTLPTAFARAPRQFQETIQRGGRDGLPFNVILMLGVAAGSEHWRVQTQGLNWDDPRIPDVDGNQMSGSPIVMQGPARLPVTLDPDTVERAIHATGAPVVLSVSAGAYLCNHLLYTTLYYLRENSAAHPRVRAGFLHVPSDEQTTGSQGSNSVTDSDSDSGGGSTLAPETTCAFPFTQHVSVLQAVLAALVTLQPEMNLRSGPQNP